MSKWKSVLLLKLYSAAISIFCSFVSLLQPARIIKLLTGSIKWSHDFKENEGAGKHVVAFVKIIFFYLNLILVQQFFAFSIS